MRSFLAARPDTYARLVRKWVAIASPFGGAPGFSMDALLTGVQFCQGWEQYFFVNRSTMHTMCAQAPAVFELLPDVRCPPTWPRGRNPPIATVVRRIKGRTETLQYSLADFSKLLGASLAGYSAKTYEGRLVQLEMNPACWQISDATRVAWRKARVPQGTQFFNIFGTGFSTAYDVEYGSVEEPVEDLTELAKGDPVRNFTFVEGDCTVPVCCATAGMLSYLCGQCVAAASCCSTFPAVFFAPIGSLSTSNLWLLRAWQI
jgi:phospholipase A1